MIARRLARDGFAVAVNGRPGDEQVTAVARAISGDGGAAKGFHADVTGEGEEHLAQLDFFVKSPVLLGRVLLPGMQARRYGRIVHIDSEVAHRPPPGRPAYAAAKNAQLGLTLSWARELAPFGITVNTVAPGFIPVERHAAVPGEDRAAYRATVPAGRMGTPADIARAVSFFAAEDAGFVTGQRIVVDGGRGLGA